MSRLGPTTPELLRDDARPYFLFWSHATVADLRAHLASPDLEESAYWMGALLCEANTRDVWLFTTEAEIRALWPRLIRYLGRARSLWAFLLGLPEPTLPPSRPSVRSTFDPRVVPKMFEPSYESSQRSPGKRT